MVAMAASFTRALAERCSGSLRVPGAASLSEPMTNAREPIAVIGTGYVGLVTAAGFAELGNEVWCVDIDVAKIEALERGEIPIYEPGLAESVAASRDRLHFTTELAPALEHARLLFIAVGTPPTYSGDADLSAVNAVVDAIPAGAERAIVMKSTVPVGTGAAIRRELNRTGKQAFAYVSCPEFLKEGAALADFRKPDRVVVGDEGGWAGDAIVELYAPLGAPLVRTDIASAEMIKLAANAFLATKISFINEIANVCEETGADVLEVARGMGLDRRIGEHFLRPGIGYGGSCLVGSETVLARHRGRTTLMSFEQLWTCLERDHDVVDGVIEPDDLKVLSWVPGEPEPMFLSVLCATRREYDGEVVDVRTKMGRRLTTTTDHPWLVSDGRGAFPERKLASELTDADWVPVAMGGAADWDATSTASLLTAVEAAEIDAERLIVRPARAEIERVAALPMVARREVFSDAPSVVARSRRDVMRSGTMSLDEAFRGDVRLASATLAPATNGTFTRTADRARRALLARCRAVSGRRVLLDRWGSATDPSGRSTRPRSSISSEEVARFWARHNFHASVYEHAHFAQSSTVESRLLAAWWTQVLGLGRGSYPQRLPDLIWDRPEADRWALLSGLFEGDGSWSLIAAARA